MCSAFALFAACHDRGTARADLDAAQAAASVAPATEPAPSSATAQAFNSPDRFSKRPYIPDVMELGRVLFNDPELSASKKMSCATCHDPRFAYGPNNDRSTQLGGRDGNQAGLRAVPSLRYLQGLPAFNEHYYEEGGAESDQGPTGGHTWDGRAATLHDQARLPLEMANPSIESVVAKVAAASYAPRFKQLFGDDVFSDATRGSTAVLLALEVFQQIPKDFYPYSSRYDAWLRGQAQLTLGAFWKRAPTAYCAPNSVHSTCCHRVDLPRYRACCKGRSSPLHGASCQRSVARRAGARRGATPFRLARRLFASLEARRRDVIANKFAFRHHPVRAALHTGGCSKEIPLCNIELGSCLRQR